jgi:hypothetical protein
VQNKIFLFILILLTYNSSAQRWHWSLGGGATLFKGDMKDWAIMPSQTQIKELLPSMNLEIGYQESQSFNYRAQLMISGLQGNSANNGWSNASLGANNGTFRSSLVEIGLLVDYNFLDFQKNRKIKNWTPYIFGGFASFFANPQNSVKVVTGSSIISHPNVMNGSFISFAIPFGIGVKYQINHLWSVKWEGGSRKTLTDRVDGWITTGADRSNFTSNFSDQYLNTSFSVTYSLQRIYCPSEYQN